MRSRVPSQYIWKNVRGFAATTSSIGLLANELKPHRGARRRGRARDRDLAVRVHGLHAGRRDDHGDGELWPSTVVASSRAAGTPVAMRGMKPSSPNAAGCRRASCRARPGHQRAVDRRGQPPLRAPLRLGDRLEPSRAASPVPERPGLVHTLRESRARARVVDRTAWAAVAATAPPRRDRARTRGRARRAAVR